MHMAQAPAFRPYSECKSLFSDSPLLALPCCLPLLPIHCLFANLLIRRRPLLLPPFLFSTTQTGLTILHYCFLTQQNTIKHDTTKQRLEQRSTAQQDKAQRSIQNTIPTLRMCDGYHINWDCVICKRYWTEERVLGYCETQCGRVFKPWSRERTRTPKCERCVKKEKEEEEELLALATRAVEMLRQSQSKEKSS